MPKRLELKDLSVGQKVRIYDIFSDKFYNARILATDVDSDHPIVLATKTTDGEDIETADATGAISHSDYICELAEYCEKFINIWRLPDGTIHSSVFSTEQVAIKDSETSSAPNVTFIKTIHIKEEI